MTSELRVDNLKGSTTGGSINVLGEGTSATTNLQQGLCKCFVRTGDSGPADVLDSFNVSSSSDEGTGQHRSVYTNNMSGADNAATGAGCNGAVNTNTLLFEITSNESTSQIEILTLLLNGTSSHSITDAHGAIVVHGDLA